MARRRYQPEFKQKVVEEHVKGGRRIAELCREYGISETAFRHWKAEYEAGLEEALAARDGLAQELREAQRRIAELEAALGRSAMEVDFLKRAFRRAGLPFPTGVKS